MDLLRLSLFVVAAGSSSLVHADWIDDFNRNCIARGGTPVHNPGGGGYCKPGAGAGTGAAGANPYGAMANSFVDLLNQIDAANDAAAKQKRAAVMQAIEDERQDALRRQQNARAADLAAIQRRLMNNGLGLKGGGNELELKLGGGAQSQAKPPEYGLPGRHVFRNDIFVEGATPTPTETIASSLLTLKIGEDATASLRTEAPPTTPQSANAKSATAATAPKADEVAALFNRLSPEDRRKIIEAAGNTPEATGAGGVSGSAPPAAGTSPGTQANAPMPLKLSAARESADKSRAEANANEVPLESLKARGEDELRTGGVALRDLEPRRPQASQSPSPLPPAPPTPPGVATSSATATATAAAPRPPTPTAPPASRPAAQETPRVQAPAPADLDLLFRDRLNPGPPDMTDDRDLLDRFQRESTPEASKRAHDALVAIAGLTMMPDDPVAGPLRAGPRERRALVAHFAPNLMERYQSDPRFTADVDFMIDLRVADTRKWRSDADRAAREVFAANTALDLHHDNEYKARLMLYESLRRGFDAFSR